jgi:hypothetical protein
VFFCSANFFKGRFRHRDARVTKRIAMVAVARWQHQRREGTALSCTAVASRAALAQSAAQVKPLASYFVMRTAATKFASQHDKFRSRAKSSVSQTARAAWRTAVRSA